MAKRRKSKKSPDVYSVRPERVHTIEVSEHIGLAYSVVGNAIEVRYGKKLLKEEIEDTEEFGVAMLALHVAANRFDPSMNCEFSTYAHHTMWGYVQHIYTRKQNCFNEKMSHGVDNQVVGRHEANPLSLVSQDEVSERVRVAVRRLPHELRAIINLELSGRNVFDIAGDLGESRQAVFQLHAEAYQRLRELLSEYRAEYEK